MDVGRRVGEGRTAEIFEFGPDRVIKLLRPGFSEESLQVEATKTAMAFRVGAPCPRVYGVEVVYSRPGLVMDRGPGPSMLDHVTSGSVEADWGKRLARLHAEILSCPGEDLADVADALERRIERAPGLSAGKRAAIRDRLHRLGPGSQLLHGDFHPENVLVADSQMMVIDWNDAHQGPPAADIARTVWLTGDHAIPPDFPDRPRVLKLARRLRETYMGAITDLTGVAASEVDDWLVPIAAARLVEGIETEQEATHRFLARWL